MNKLLLSILLILSFSYSKGQTSKFNQSPIRIGIFVPLYLDSIFHNNQFMFGNNFPRFALQGIDFLQGAQIAIDSFPINNTKIEYFFYDTKSDSQNVEFLIKHHQLKSLSLIIGWVKDEDVVQLASFAKYQQIPFISAIYPNDGGVTNNPYFMIVNATLKTHCEAIFSYILQNNSADNIIHVFQTGEQEDRILGYFNKSNHPDKKSLLQIKKLQLDSNYSSIKNKLDSNKNNVIIVGSLDEDFAYSICKSLYNVNKKYKLTVMGMPNWDSFSFLSKNNKNSLRDFPIVYTSIYYNNKEDSFSTVIQNTYETKYKGRPSDYAFKGFEMTYLFSRLLSNYSTDLITNRNDPTIQLFSNFNFVPVTIEKSSYTPDYWENKHLFFLKRINGINSRVW